MKRELLPSVGNQASRAAWFSANAKPGMTFSEAILLNEEAMQLFPVTDEERRQKTESLMLMPEFVL